MKLYFMRHGEAESLQFQGGPDADSQRALTAQGRLDVAAVVESRKESLSDIEVILCSPYLRAQQSAQIAAQHLGFRDKALICNELIPDSNFVTLERTLKKLIDETDPAAILLASHQPLLGKVLSTLTGNARLELISPAWLVAVETDIFAPGFGEFCWLQKPDKG